MWRWKRPPACRAADGRCEFNVAHGMVYNSPDGKVFRVRRLVCALCGERAVVAQRQDNASAPQDGAVEANF